MTSLVSLIVLMLIIAHVLGDTKSLSTHVSQAQDALFSTPDPFCTGLCFPSSAGQFIANAFCRNRVGCAVSICTTTRRNRGLRRRRSKRFPRSTMGFACMPAPPVPIITEGPLTLPSILAFPSNTVVGGEVSAEITVAVDELSSSSREDFYLLSDATGSMAEEIAQVRQDFSALVQARTNASENVAFGVGYYRDETDTPPFENLQSMTEDFSLATAAINRLEAIGGMDIPEANLYALSKIATSDEIGWRPSTRRILVYFGDAPGHEPTCPDDMELTRQDVIDQLNENGIAVVATNFGTAATGLNAMTTGTPGTGRFGCGTPALNTRDGQATDITSGTKGVIVSANDPRELIDVIVDAVQSLDQELSVTTTDCDGKVDIQFSPDLPLLIAAGETKTIMERATILPGACDTPDGFKCEIEVQISGVGVKQTVQATTIAGCTDEDNFFS